MYQIVVECRTSAPITAKPIYEARAVVMGDQDAVDKMLGGKADQVEASGNDKAEATRALIRQLDKLFAELGEDYEVVAEDNCDE